MNVIEAHGFRNCKNSANFAYLKIFGLIFCIKIQKVLFLQSKILNTA